MTLIALPTILYYPSIPAANPDSDGGGIRPNPIDADGEYYGVAFQIPETDDGKAINKIGWRTVTVTTGGDIDVRLEGLDSSGFADGVLASANANLVVAVGSGDDDAWFTSALTSSHTVAAGDVLCAITKRPTSGTFSGNVAAHRRTLKGALFPYEVNNTGADGKTALSLEPPIMAVGYSDGTYLRMPGVWPVDNAATVVFNNASTNAENGLKFQVPFPARIVGMWMWGGSDNAAADFSVHLYDSGGVPQDTDANRLATIAVDGQHVATDALAGLQTRMFTSAVELAKDTVYRLTLEATTANNCRFNYWEVDAAALLQAMPGGSNFTWIEDDGAGGWTDNATRLPIMGLLIDKLDDGSGGGGLSFINQRRNAMIGR